MRFGLISALALAVLAVIFALQNPQPMEVNLLFFDTEGSTALVLILTFAFGVIVGLISSLPGRIRARRRVKELEKEISAPSSSRPSSPGTRSSSQSASSRSSSSSPSTERDSSA
ncbi:MAG: lipopolysaccharide assembly LapA domain-containing protein [Salinivenus sp.]